MKYLSTAGLLLTLVLLGLAQAQAQTVSVSFPAARSQKPLDGRLLLLVSNDPKAMTDPKAEPRMQINDTPKTQMVFGVTVDGWNQASRSAVGDEAKGYPRAKSERTFLPATTPYRPYWMSMRLSTAPMAGRSSWRPIAARASSGVSRRAI